VPGFVTVTGHTDNVPGGTLRYPSNYELSVGRARGVADQLLRTIKDPSRIKVEGVADSRPLVPNTTAEGRARNRRVEIFLRKTTVQ
jgi:flagellar motor protein MotB